MAQFNLKLTEKGVLLLAQAAAGKTVVFQKMVMGDGSYSGNPESVEEVISPKQELPIYRLARNGPRVSVRSILTLGEVTEPFWWRELGLYAADSDGGRLVLAAYGNAQDKADYIAAGGILDERILDVSFVVDTAADIAADVSGVLFAGDEEFQAHKSDGTAHVVALTHEKNGTVHALTGLDGASGLISCVFTATGAFEVSDTIQVDGTAYTIRLSNGEEAEDNLFVSGAVVPCIVDTAGKTVNFKAAGGQRLPAGTTAIVKTFTANGTFTVPQTGKYRVTVFGKGGNGSDSYATSSDMIYNGTGGGAGGIAVSNLTLTKGDTYPVTVTSSTSSFGSLLSAAAGKDGSGDTAGTGGAAAGGNLLAENGENGTAGDGAYPWGGGAGGGYSANAVSMSPFASDSGGTGGDSASVSSGSREPGKTQKLTGYGLPAFGTGGGGGGYESSGYNAFVYVRALAGAEGMPGAVIVEAAIE